MKNRSTAPKKTRLLPALAFIVLLCYACQGNIDTPELSCPEMSMTATLGNNTHALNLIANTIFRQKTDTGGHKYLSLEAVSDSLKVIINVTDGIYTGAQLADDTFHLKDYYYSKAANLQGGLVVAAEKNSLDYTYFTTDTSCVIITKINTANKTVSGRFYFAANSRTITGSGIFEHACYVSLP
ncbi:hypothetical protein [Chitinophaga sp. MM2321]|uniref:hypothetical protein n=1 Tax=Chitinophaga sp. MM2321 TaxID=3137178 RepID=UPI0032D592D5